MKQEKAAATEADFSSKVAIPGAASIVTAAAMTGYNEIQRDGNGHGAEASDLIESVEVAESLNRTEVLDEMLREEPEDLQAESDVAGESEEELQEADTSVEPDSSIVHSSEVSLTQHDIGAKLTDSHITHHTLDISIPGGEVIPEDEVRPTVQSDSDIEDIVNLLEMRSSPKSRPKSIASIPDEEVDEIPDEE
jgi:hypothetical protein